MICHLLGENASSIDQLQSQESATSSPVRLLHFQFPLACCRSGSEETGSTLPLAWVIIGGLVSSTLLARIVTPVMYKLIAPAVA